jgi:hypothetical protein
MFFFNKDLNIGEFYKKQEGLKISCLGFCKFFLIIKVFFVNV